MPDEEPKTQHIWLPGGRTLCDRRGPEDLSLRGEEAAQAPYCGACTFITWTLHRLDWLGAADAERDGRGIWPPNWRDALPLIGATGWGDVFDMEWLAEDANDVKYHYPKYLNEQRAREANPHPRGEDDTA